MNIRPGTRPTGQCEWVLKISGRNKVSFPSAPAAQAEATEDVAFAYPNDAEQTMDWIGITIAGLCGAVAAAAAQLLVGFKKERKSLYVMAVVVLFFGLRYSAKVYVEPGLRLWDTQRQLKEIPLFKELSLHDPAVFQRVARVINESTQNGATKEKMYPEVTEIITEILPRYVPKASDDSIIAYVNLMVSEMKSLDQVNSDACYALLFPHKSAEPDLAIKYMGEKYKEDSLKVLGDIVSSAIENPQTKPDKGRAEEVLQPILLELARTYGQDLALINATTLDNTGRKKVCEMTKEMFEKISALPKPDASLALRDLLSSKD